MYFFYAARNNAVPITFILISGTISLYDKTTGSGTSRSNKVNNTLRMCGDTKKTGAYPALLALEYESNKLSRTSL